MRNPWDEEINGEEVVWRYMKVERFIEMLESSKIYFAAATEFTDKFEGAVAIMPPDFPIDPRYMDMDPIENAFRELKRLTKINCWHRANYESSAMWELYAGRNRGVVICSTPNSIREGLLPFRLREDYATEDLWAGNVHYVDLIKERAKVAGFIQQLFIKHQPYFWEKEFRLAISVSGAEEFGVRVPEFGIYVPINPAVLIKKIILGPDLDNDEQESIISYTTAAGLSERIVKSSLLGMPRYR